MQILVSLVPAVLLARIALRDSASSSQGVTAVSASLGIS
jgi:hypothetical protein